MILRSSSPNWQKNWLVYSVCMCQRDRERGRERERESSLLLPCLNIQEAPTLRLLSSLCFSEGRPVRKHQGVYSDCISQCRFFSIMLLKQLSAFDTAIILENVIEEGKVIVENSFAVNCPRFLVSERCHFYRGRQSDYGRFCTHQSKCLPLRTIE